MDPRTYKVSLNSVSVLHGIYMRFCLSNEVDMLAQGRALDRVETRCSEAGPPAADAGRLTTVAVYAVASSSVQDPRQQSLLLRSWVKPTVACRMGTSSASTEPIS